ncbi:MAG: hypothetical protein MJZ37_00080 [Bacilli bacterium]|nr:hypothetical protein [Bacilli bacterium]
MTDHERLMDLCKKIKKGEVIMSYEEERRIAAKYHEMSHTSSAKRRMLIEQRMKLSQKPSK